ncbi:MAG: zf-HC2 domain-containing protein [Gammaproteobacteria bacterium]
MSRALSCRDTTVLVSEGRDRPLTKAELADLRGHLTGCVRCQAAREQFEILFRGIERYLHGDTPEAQGGRGAGA